MNEILTETELSVRKDFSKIPSILEIPDLIEIQKQTFERFLQTDVEPEKRENTGLQAVFTSVFPIKDFNDSASLEFVGYTLEEPKYDVQECLQRGMTYAAPFKVTIRLVAWDQSEGSQAIRDVKEQEVYFGEIPIMTEHGTFIINGTERVIVSQLHRSPGIFFDTTTSSTVSASGKKLYSCRVIPYRGSWLDLEFDHKDLIYARIDRRRKIFVTVLLKALGYTPEDLLAYFYTPERIRWDGKKYEKSRRAGSAGRPALSARGARRGRRGAGAQGPQVHRGGRAQAARGRRRVDPDPGRGPGPHGRGQARRADRHRRRADRRGRARVQRGAHQRQARGAEDPRHPRVPAALPRPARQRHRAARHAARGQDAAPGGGDHRDLPAPAPGRSADRRDCDEPVPQPVLQPGALRPLARRSPEGEPQAQLRPGSARGVAAAGRLGPDRGDRAARAADAAPRRHHRRGQVPDRPEDRHRPRPPHRRHRPPRQPARARGRRAAREPVPHRSGAHGARDQGAHVAPGDRDADAARPDQLQAGLGGGEGVLRLEPALAVHGPDQPALGGDAQAPPVGARAGRSDARARGLRGARRAPDALRAHLPDRDARRSEHRADRVALDLRASQRPRLHRDAVPRRRQRPRHRPGEVPVGARRGAARRSRRPTRRSTRRAVTRATSCSRARPASSWWCRPAKSR